MAAEGKVEATVYTAYGNNGRFEGSYWIMDTDKNAPAGDPSEKCGNTAFYRIPTASIISRTISGYCFNLPGNPAGWMVTNTGTAITSLKKGESLLEDAAYRLEKTADFTWKVQEASLKRSY